jgi:phosphoenolpyruvate phosphomutase
MKNKKVVYVPMGADLIHSGHINIIEKAKKYGKVIIGLFSDEAISEYKRVPSVSYDDRYNILKNFKGVSKIIKHNHWDYTENLRSIKPNYFIHGDDWKKGIQKKKRTEVLNLLKKWNGKLIEVPYTQKPIISQDHRSINSTYFSSSSRVSRLKKILNYKKFVRIIECHNPLIGMIIENLNLNKKNKIVEFDALWSSSLTESAVMGKRDDGSLDLNTRISNLNNVLNVTSKPIIFDADNGGREEHLPELIHNMERLGISCIVMEDKTGIKINSLFENQTKATQDSISNFCKKIKICKKASRYDDFLVAARIESLILKRGMNDALKRAESYSRAGADLILIHSKSKKPDEILKFAKKFKKSKYFIPLIAVPSSYSIIKEDSLQKAGFSMVIYANQLLRASVITIEKTLKSILKNSRSYEIEKNIMPIKKILNIIP